MGMLLPKWEMESPFKYFCQSWTLMHGSVLASDARKRTHTIADWVQWMHLLPESRALPLCRGQGNRDLCWSGTMCCACCHRLLTPCSVSSCKCPLSPEADYMCFLRPGLFTWCLPWRFSGGWYFSSHCNLSCSRDSRRVLYPATYFH